MPHKGNPKGIAAITKIQSLARSYRKEHPKTKWTECIKAASKKYNSQKKKKN